jgi:hypothetical protein
MPASVPAASILDGITTSTVTVKAVIARAAMPSVTRGVEGS